MPGANRLARLRSEMILRRPKVAELFEQGKESKEMAAILGVSEPTICRDLKALKQQANENAPALYESRRERLLEELWWVVKQGKKTWIKAGEQEVLGKITGALKEIGRMIGAYEQPEDDDLPTTQIVNNQQNNIHVYGVPSGNPELDSLLAALRDRAGAAPDRPDCQPHDELPRISQSPTD